MQEINQEELLIKIAQGQISSNPKMNQNKEHTKKQLKYKINCNDLYNYGYKLELILMKKEKHI